MRGIPDESRTLGTRTEREMAYWDRVYDSNGDLFQNLSWMEYVEQTTYNAHFFNSLLKPLRERRILSIGGGVDRLAVALAQEGHTVTCVDISPFASARTEELARQAGVANRLSAQSSSCEEMAFGSGSFDVAICKRALHHMEIAKVVPILYNLLDQNGIFIAEEPVCLHPLVRWVHDRFPFYGNQPHTLDEKELTLSDLDLIKQTFRSTRLCHFDFLARESVAYRLNKRRWNRLLYLLGRTDFYLVNHVLPPLKRLCNYVMLRATK
jgi:SAM-dependent methyltransferase